MKRRLPATKAQRAGLGGACLLFGAVLLILFHGVFLPGYTLFSNDGPLSELMAQCHRLPGRFFGCWLDLGGIGINGGSAPPNISLGLQWLLGPIWFSRLYAMVSLLVFGLSAWCFFRQSRLSPIACILGGVAAIFNSTFFSVACWGMSPHVLTAAMSFLALAALVDTSPRYPWLRVILAGFAVGMGVAEGADVGAIFSLYIAAFIVYQAGIAEGSRVRNLAVGLGRLAVVAACAAFLASQAIYGLVNTSIKGIVEARPDRQTDTQHWDWATQWSLPKEETLGLIVPGLFGYRMDTPGGGEYWGKIGRDPVWDEYSKNGSQGPSPDGFLRYTGSGYYIGVLVVFIACWVVMQSLRGKNSVFNLERRKWLWFWLGVSVISLLLAFGRFAPFYRLVYVLPYFSTIRNPVKFLYLFSFTSIIFFAFGVDALQQKYMPTSGTDAVARWRGIRSWWNKAEKVEKYWVYGCVLVWLLAVAGWMVYAHQRGNLEQYMRSTQVLGNLGSIVSFSIHRIVWFLLFFLLSAGLMALVFSGAFAGKRAKVGGILLGLLLVADLGLANRPWIVYWNYDEKFTSNPIIDVLRDKPYEHRVAIVPMRMPPGDEILSQLYQIGWLQQQFPFYNIQSFETVEMPRMPEDISAFAKAYQQIDASEHFFRLSRAWQFTNTRYVLAPETFARVWNKQDYLKPLEIVTRFELLPKPGVETVTNAGQLTAATDSKGRFALLQFTNALPRAKLYNQWQFNTNDDDALKQLFNPAFDPEHSVLVDSGLPSDSSSETNNAPAGTVEYLNYNSKDLLLKANATASSVLLLNDHFDPNWKVLVDGKPAQLLRCNFLMRGVQLASGTHLVEFKFQPPSGLLYASLAADALGLMMVGIVLMPANKKRFPMPTPDIEGASALLKPEMAAQPKPGIRRKSVANMNLKKSRP